ncbi:MAG: hypothetical protein AB1488_01840 [Nitrospirota bacterium]
MKYLEASTMTSGSLQKNIAIRKEERKRKVAGLRSGNETFEVRKAKKIPNMMIKKILTTLILSNVHAQLVSTLSSR